MTDTERLEKIKAETDKLRRYITRFVSRTINIEDALGINGNKYLNNIIELVDDVEPRG